MSKYNIQVRSNSKRHLGVVIATGYGIHDSKEAPTESISNSNRCGDAPSPETVMSSYGHAPLPLSSKQHLHESLRSTNEGWKEMRELLKAVERKGDSL